MLDIIFDGISADLRMPLEAMVLLDPSINGVRGARLFWCVVGALPLGSTGPDHTLFVMEIVLADL